MKIHRWQQQKENMHKYEKYKDNKYSNVEIFKAAIL